MSSGAEPEDLDLGCSGKTNAGSPEKKHILFLQFSKFILKKYSNMSQGLPVPNLLVYISPSTEIGKVEEI